MTRAVVLAPVWAWLAVFVMLPLLIVLVVSVAEPSDGVPPIAVTLSTGGYATVTDAFYLRAVAQSVRVASVASVACLLIGYPMALAIARAAPRRRPALLTLVILPFWTGFLLRLTAWIGLLKDGGWIDTALISLGLPPAHLLYTPSAVYLGITYCYLPFMVLPLYARLTRRDVALEEAAADLGASPWRVFLTITLPLSLPGIVAGLLLVFIPAMGEYVIPELLGGPGVETIGRVLWSEFFENRDWPTASALATILTVVLVLPAAVWQWRQGRR